MATDTPIRTFLANHPSRSLALDENILVSLTSLDAIELRRTYDQDPIVIPCALVPDLIDLLKELAQ